jgi:hypothetical protein
MKIFSLQTFPLLQFAAQSDNNGPSCSTFSTPFTIALKMVPFAAKIYTQGLFFWTIHSHRIDSLV